jgi:hypothetical protein
MNSGVGPGSWYTDGGGGRAGYDNYGQAIGGAVGCDEGGHGPHAINGAGATRASNSHVPNEIQLYELSEEEILSEIDRQDYSAAAHLVTVLPDLAWHRGD